MPFDGKTFAPVPAETKPSWQEILPTLTMADFVAWLRTQDPKTAYDYGSITDCLVVRYMRARGIPVAHAGPTQGSLKDGARIRVPSDLMDVAFSARWGRRGWTYGSALRAAEFRLYGPWWKRALRKIGLVS